LNNSKGPIKCMAYLVKLQDACQAAVAGHRVPVAPAQHQLALLDCLQPSSGAVGMCDCIYTYEHLQLVACHFWAGCMWPSRSWLPRCGIMPASNGPHSSYLNSSANSYANLWHQLSRPATVASAQDYSEGSAQLPSAAPGAALFLGELTSSLPLCGAFACANTGPGTAGKGDLQIARA